MLQSPEDVSRLLLLYPTDPRRTLPILPDISRAMAPGPLFGDTEQGQKVNIRINDATTAMNIHKAAVTRDYIKQPRLSK